MNEKFLEAIKMRRSIYRIGNKKIVSEEKIGEIVKEAIKHTPTSFNCQSGRILVLLGENHLKMWAILKEKLRTMIPEKKFKSTEEKIESFRNGYGTVLFFEDMETVKGLQNRFPAYAEHFPVWSQHSSGILQFIVWTSLELEGLGASLQHYGNLIEKEVQKNWEIPETWQLISQMPFGNVLAGADEKEFKPVKDRVKIVR